VTALRWLGTLAELPLFRLAHRRCAGLVTIRNPDLFAHYCATHKTARAANLRLVPLLIDTIAALGALAALGLADALGVT
jgi:hypothetical protein